MIRFNTKLCIPVEEALANIARAKSSGMPFLDIREPHDRSLAIVGGGPSAASRLQADDVWGINGTCAWLHERGVDATFFSCDPKPMLSDCITPTIKRGIIAACADSSVVQKLNEVLFFIPQGYGTDDPLTIPNGHTSVTNAPQVALYLGYRDIHIYGCDSSYEGETHVYPNPEAYPSDLLIEADGKVYRTQPEYLMQAEFLVVLAKELPVRLHCGGLTAALQRTGGAYEAVHVPADIRPMVAA